MLVREVHNNLMKYFVEFITTYEKYEKGEVGIIELDNVARGLLYHLFNAAALAYNYRHRILPLIYEEKARS